MKRRALDRDEEAPFRIRLLIPAPTHHGTVVALRTLSLNTSSLIGDFPPLKLNGLHYIKYLRLFCPPGLSKNLISPQSHKDPHNQLYKVISRNFGFNPSALGLGPAKVRKTQHGLALFFSVFLVNFNFFNLARFS